MKIAEKEARKLLLFGSFFLFVLIMMFQIQHGASIFQTASVALAQAIGLDTNLNASTYNIKDIFKLVQGSVVQVTRKVPLTTPDSQLPGGSTKGNRTTLGPGFVYDKQGHIITNNHVVGNAKRVEVTFIDGNRYSATVTGTDPYGDLAVLTLINDRNSTNSRSINSSSQEFSPLTLEPLSLGNSLALYVGDPVIAIGNPYGLDNTITTGIVSQIGRDVPSPVGAYSIPDVIQTDAALNPGNSGGPLFNMIGEVVGITFGGIPGGVNFAIPSNTVKKIVPILIEKGNYTHAYLGLNGATLTSDLGARFNNKLPSDLKGVVLDTIVKNGPADKAGIKGSTTDQYGQKHGGDIMTAVDGKNITRNHDLLSYIEQNKSPGNNITLTVYREGKNVNVNVILGQRPSLLSLVPYPSQPLPPPSKPPTIPPNPHTPP